ncbi:unnamed protein product (macronuclear) [Paramecium tetraurelia]|uniref:EF-hand domain-containing protein n=1 Tax=Paramecium tetraurelia TaxID=5888 RepID=A0CSB1_PARTE|nr:uncharacterized protein GSPATT00009950001 [Paramecium tetraurelia]CAK73678.1 unnamed protein product [Paramecium tetraurelia]|eukprot:XP_001441075.1 hypothetical protein (macronuclear) [Paramecium tetraurelia strain d4-2]
MYYHNPDPYQQPYTHGQYNEKTYRNSGFLTETQDDYPDYQYYDPYQSQLHNRTYLNDVRPLNYTYYEQSPYPVKTGQPQTYFDPNDPSNIPFMPHERYDDGYEEYVLQFIRNLPRSTQNFEEVAFAKYLAECSIIDKKVWKLQRMLKQDQRFNVKLLFDFFDSKKNGTIDYNEFQLGLQKLDIILNSIELSQMFLRYGGNDDNQISSVEFKYMLLGPDDSQQFMQFGAMHYMHHPLKQNIPQFLSVAQRELISEIMHLQLQLERNLNFIKEVIGTKDILLALFKQLDIGMKGYITIQDLVIYMNELGGQFEQYDLKGCLDRMSKVHCSRINFNEFKKEFFLDEKKKSEQDQNIDIMSDRNKTRQKDYIQELHQRTKDLQNQQLQAQKLSTDRKSQPLLTTTTQVKQPQPYVVQPPVAQKRKQEQPINQLDDDLDDLLFPGFQKYELQPPDQEY